MFAGYILDAEHLSFFIVLMRYCNFCYPVSATVTYTIVRLRIIFQSVFLFFKGIYLSDVLQKGNN